MSKVNVLFWAIFVTCLSRNLTYFEGELPFVSELCLNNRNTGQVLLPPDLSDKHLTHSWRLDFMRGSRNFRQRGGGGGGSRSV